MIRFPYVCLLGNVLQGDPADSGVQEKETVFEWVEAV